MKSIEDVIHEMMLKKAETMCEKYCKYGEQYKKDQEAYDGENPTFILHCSKCPMNEFYR